MQGHVWVVEELGELRRHEDLQGEQQLRDPGVVLGHAAVHSCGNRGGRGWPLRESKVAIKGDEGDD